jgi:hypothetical protein
MTTLIKTNSALQLPSFRGKKLLHAICFASAIIQKKLETLIYFENSEVLFWGNGVCCNTGKERRKESL